MNYPGGPNVEWSSDETYAKPRFNISAPSHQETYFSAGTMPIEWSNTGPITRVNIYWRLVGDVDWTPIVKNYQNSGSYIWDVPFLNSSGTIVPKETTKAFVQTLTGESARLRAIIDALGSVDNIIVLDGGYAYEGTDAIIVNDETLTVTAPTISPNVIAGTITGSTIYAVGSGFTPSPVNQIEIKVENANNERVYEIMKREITYQAQVTAGSNLLTNIVPDISVAQNLTELALYVGMPVTGAGIPAGAYITQILSGTNQIQISTNANVSSALTLINGGKLDGFITIK
jgi:hypothetical protein